MTTRRCDIAIIGAGTAGLHAYKAAKATGADVLIIERGPGGSTCTATGCIPSKLLIAAGRAAAQARKADLFGIRTGAVSVDGHAVLHRLRSKRDEANGKIRDELLAIPDDHRLHGEARFIAPTFLLVDGEIQVEANTVVIAAGAHPTVPEALEPVRRVLHTHESIFEIADLPASLAVIGAGPQGLELAQAFARLGVEVVLLDKGKSVGKLKDPDCEHAARAAFADEFAIHTGVEINAAMDGTQASLRWSGDSEGTVLVDMVLVAAGQVPNVAALHLDAAGLALDDDGVPVFEHETRRCGDSHVFIAGDVDAWRPVLHEASRGGIIAGALAGGGEGLPVVPSLAIAFTEPNLVEIGTPFDSLPDGARTGTAKADKNARAGIDDEDAGLVRLYADAGGALIGGTIVLTGGEHLGQSLALGITQGMDAATFAEQAWYHPVLEELLQEAARAIADQISGKKTVEP